MRPGLLVLSALAVLLLPLASAQAAEPPMTFGLDPASPWSEVQPGPEGQAMGPPTEAPERLAGPDAMVTPSIPGHLLNNLVPELTWCDPTGCHRTENNFDDIGRRSDSASPEAQAAPEAAEEPEAAATAAVDEPFNAAASTADLEEAGAEPAPAAPSTEPSGPPLPGPREPAPEPAARAAFSLAPQRPGGLAWALAGFALPGALLAKILSVLALRRDARAARATLREAVLDAVARQPGIRHRELVRRIGHGNGTVEHHVRALIAEGRVARVRHGASTAYFVAGDLTAHEARLRLALQGRTSRRLALDVAAHPGSRLTDVARRVGVSLATAHYQAGKLAALGLLRDAAGTGAGGRRLEATPAALACLAAMEAEGAAVASPFGAPLGARSVPSLA